MMRALIAAALISLLGPTPNATPAPSEPASSSPQRHLSNAAPSVDALLDRFLQALAAKDKGALRRMRVTESEYLDLILPWSVDEGKPRRNYPDDVSKYFWSVLDTKSIYTEANILNDMGGHRLTIKKVQYLRGVKRYATYTAYKQLAITLEDEHGQEDTLRTGSIAEIDGQYKFISFVRN